ncbi:hypothetical protein HQ520_13120, partial [bacterium]|nr:hypothetical protein [bacterium]
MRQMAILFTFLILAALGCDQSSSTSSYVAQEATATPTPTPTPTPFPTPAPGPDFFAKSPQGANERFYVVKEKLDVGGGVFIYEHLGDRLSEMIEELRSASGVLADSGEGFENVLDLLETAGLPQVKDIGISQVRVGEMSRGKIFLGTEGAEPALFRVFNGPPQSSSLLVYAPSDCGIYLETHFDPMKALELVREGIGAIHGQEKLDEFNSQIRRKSSELGVDIEGFLAGLGNRFAVVVRTNESQSVDLADQVARSVDKFLKSPGTLQVPAFDGALLVQQPDPTILDKVKTMLDRSGTPYKDASDPRMGKLIVDLSADPDLPPNLILAHRSDALLVSSQEGLMDALVGAKEKGSNLGQAYEYQRLTKGVPDKANHVFFVSPGMGQSLRDVLKANLSDQTAQGINPEPLMELLTPWLSGMALTGVHEPEGGSLVSLRPAIIDGRELPAGSGILSGAAAVPILLAGAFLMDMEGDAEGGFAAFPDNPQTRAPERPRVQADLRMMATAIEAYRIDWHS